MAARFDFYYGTMGCGKSTYVLQLNYNLKAAGFYPILVKPAVDTRDPGVVRSRMGVEHSATLVGPDDDLLGLFTDRQPSHVLVDEAQFMSSTNVADLVKVVDICDTDVYAFGLRTDYTGKLFPATAEIMAVADTMMELPMVYKDGRKSTMHVRYVNGSPVFEGDPIFVGDIDEMYESVSRREYFRLRDINTG